MSEQKKETANKLTTPKYYINSYITGYLYAKSMEVDSKTIHRKITPTSVSDTLENARIHRPLFWEKQKQICEEKHLMRSVHQRRCNPDYKIAHPAECRGHSEGTGLTIHPEARIRILSELANKIATANHPPVAHIARYNRT